MRFTIMDPVQCCSFVPMGKRCCSSSCQWLALTRDLVSILSSIFEDDREAMLLLIPQAALSFPLLPNQRIDVCEKGNGTEVVGGNSRTLQEPGLDKIYDCYHFSQTKEEILLEVPFVSFFPGQKVIYW